MNVIADVVSVFCIGFGTGMIGFAGILLYAIKKEK